MWRSKTEEPKAYRVARYGDVTVVTFTADRYPSEDVAVVEAAMAAAEMSAPDGRLVLDFANVEWLASTVFRPIMQTLKTMRGNGGRYSSTGGGPLVHTMLRFFPDLGLLDTKAEAIAALSPEARVIYGREEGQR